MDCNNVFVWFHALILTTFRVVPRSNFGPVFVEHSKEVGRIEGSVPACLKGTIYCRNGPNPHFAPVQKHHWFDGDGMLHAVRFADDGSVF